MSTKKQNTTALIIQTTTPSKTFIEIDFHKRYSVYHVLNESRKDVAKGRIKHSTSDEFGKLVKRFPGCRMTFEATMDRLRPCRMRLRVTRWHWLFALFEEHLPADDIVMADPFKDAHHREGAGKDG